MARPPAADDFPAIRARLEELRRERGGQAPLVDDRTPEAPRPYAVGSRAVQSRSPGLTPLMRRALQRLPTI